MDDIKLGITFDLFKTLRHTICCFQETSRRTGHDIREHEGTKFICSGKRRRRVGGVGIMIADSVQLIDIIPASDRILQVLVKINNINISIINCYAPTEDAKKSKKETLYRVLEKTIKCTPAKYKQIVISDMNATIGSESHGFWKCLGTTNNNLKTNDNGERLLKLSESHKCKVENTIRPSTKGEKHLDIC